VLDANGKIKPSLKFVSGSVFNVYVVWSFTSATDPATLLTNPQLIYDSVYLALDSNPDPDVSSQGISIFKLNSSTSRVEEYAQLGMTVTDDYIQFKVPYHIYAIVYDLIYRFKGRKLNVRQLSNQAYQFLYNWCLYTIPMITFENEDWSDTEWVAFILCQAGILPRLHPSYLSQQELFLLSYHSIVSDRATYIRRLPNHIQDEKLSHRYQQFFGRFPSEEQMLTENNCLAIRIYIMDNPPVPELGATRLV